MFTIIKSKVNGQDGFICTIQINPHEKPQTFAVSTKDEVFKLLDLLS